MPSMLGFSFYMSSGLAKIQQLLVVREHALLRGIWGVLCHSGRFADDRV